MFCYISATGYLGQVPTLHGRNTEPIKIITMVIIIEPSDRDAQCEEVINEQIESILQPYYLLLRVLMRNSELLERDQ